MTASADVDSSGASWFDWRRPPVRVTGRELTVDRVAELARGGATVVLPKETERQMSRGHRVLQEHVRQGNPVYGWNTGVGALDGRRVTRAENRAHQRRLLRSHAAGVGEPMAAGRVRAMMLARANMLAGGHSGIRPTVVRGLLGLLARGVTPHVPERGSVGASDLAPLAHVGLVLLGEGRAWVEGELLPGGPALARAGMRPADLAGRDALALINGLGQTVGIGALAAYDAARVLEAAEVGAALSMVATGNTGAQLDPFLAQARPHPGVIDSAERIRTLLQGTEGQGAFREPLSTRCAHQVTGAARQALESARHVVETELNAAADNPTLTPDGRVIANASNFHGQVVADALEHLGNAVTSLAVVSEHRIDRLLDADRNEGLPSFLIHPQAGPSSGLMIAQYTAASLVAELRTRSVPASIQSIPTCAGTEDHVSMSALAARRAAWCVETTAQVVAIELLTATQALDLAAARLPPALEPVYRSVRNAVPVMIEDRPLGEDIDAIAALVRSGQIRPAP